jgi:hypothetical protein
LKDCANARYQVEVGLVKLMEMRRLATLGDLVGRINELESALRTGQPLAERKSPQPAPESAPTKAPSRSAAARSVPEAAPQAVRQEAAPAAPAEQSSPTEPEAAIRGSGSTADQIKAVLEKKKRRMLIAALDAASRVELEGEELVIEFTSAARQSRETLAKAENAKVLREAGSEVCGREVGIRFAIKDSASESNAALSPEDEERRAKKQTRQTVAQNPTVQQVLRAFGGEIVDIKTQ